MNKTSQQRRGSDRQSKNSINPPQIELSLPDNIINTNISPNEFINSLYQSLEILPEIPYPISNYEPQRPANNVPSEYPKIPFQRIIQPDFFRKFDISTLFYIFFYFPGTAQQYLSGKELISRGWTYHTAYQTWFIRISEPKEINSNYEIADYEYFDYKTSKSWCIRKRIDFKFEYIYLEN